MWDSGERTGLIIHIFQASSTLTAPRLCVAPTRWSTTLLSKVNVPDATLGPYAVQIWSRNVRKFERTNYSNSAVWMIRSKAEHWLIVWGKPAHSQAPPRYCYAEGPYGDPGGWGGVS